jgi:transcriptional regulator with XRE-family HTH domain
LQHYNGIFTQAALERLTGINQRQLQRYACGANKPRENQAIKITKALHNLGKELLAIEL